MEIKLIVMLNNELMTETFVLLKTSACYLKANEVKNTERVIHILNTECI